MCNNIIEYESATIITKKLSVESKFKTLSTYADLKILKKIKIILYFEKKIKLASVKIKFLASYKYQ